MIDQLALLYKGIRQVIDKNHQGTRSNTIKDSKSKLSKLPKNEFLELVTDVYDELIRRKETNNCVPFLPKSSAYHPKRNMVRQKLSTLSQPKFSALAEDVILEIINRFPNLDQQTISLLEQNPLLNNDIKTDVRATGSSGYSGSLKQSDSLSNRDSPRPKGKLAIPKKNQLNHENNAKDALKAPNLDVLTKMVSDETNTTDNGPINRDIRSFDKPLFHDKKSIAGGNNAVNNNHISNRYEAELTISYKRILELEQALQESQTVNFQAQVKQLEANFGNGTNSDNIKRLTVLLDEQAKSQNNYLIEVEKNKQLNQELVTALSKNQELESQLKQVHLDHEILLKTIEELEEKNISLTKEISDIKSNPSKSDSITDRGLNSHNEPISQSPSNQLNINHVQPSAYSNKKFNPYSNLVTKDMCDTLETHVIQLRQATDSNIFKDMLNHLQLVVLACQTIVTKIDRFEQDVDSNPSELERKLIIESKSYNSNLSDALANLLNMIESYPQTPNQSWITQFNYFGTQLVTSGNGLYNLFSDDKQPRVVSSISTPAPKNIVNSEPSLPVHTPTKETSQEDEDEDDDDNSPIAVINKELMSNPMFLAKKNQTNKPRKYLKPVVKPQLNHSANLKPQQSPKLPPQSNPIQQIHEKNLQLDEPSIRDSIKTNDFVPISFGSDSKAIEKQIKTASIQSTNSFASYYCEDSRQTDSTDDCASYLKTIEEYADEDGMYFDTRDPDQAEKYQTQIYLGDDVDKLNESIENLALQTSEATIKHSINRDNKEAGSTREINELLNGSSTESSKNNNTSDHLNSPITADSNHNRAKTEILVLDTGNESSDHLDTSINHIPPKPKPTDPVQKLSKAQKHLSDALEIKFAVNAANNLLLHATVQDDTSYLNSSGIRTSQSPLAHGVFNSEIQNLLDFLKQKSQVLVDIIHKLLQSIREESWSSMVVPINDLLATGSQIVHRSKSTMRKCPSFPNRPQMEEVLHLMEKQNNNLIRLRQSLTHLIDDTAHIDAVQLKNQLATYAFDLAKYTKDCMNFAR